MNRYSGEQHSAVRMFFIMIALLGLLVFFPMHAVGAANSESQRASSVLENDDRNVALSDEEENNNTHYFERQRSAVNTPNDTSLGAVSNETPNVPLVTNPHTTGSITTDVTTNTGSSTPPVSSNTRVSAPQAKVFSRCPGSQDSFIATVTDLDVVRIYIYKSPTLDNTNLVAVANVVNGKTEEVFIGDNALDKLYLVAVDSEGNKSESTALLNDIVVPLAPQLSLERKDTSIRATWSNVDSASKYLLKWQPVGEASWSEQEVTVSSYDIPSLAQKEYEVSIASRDSACNQSAASVVRSAAVVRQNVAPARGGVANHESQILKKVQAQGSSKDGVAGSATGAGNSPYTVQEDRNRNGIKDSEESSQTNKPGTTGTTGGNDTSPNATGSPAPEGSPPANTGEEDAKDGGSANLRNYSRWIIGVAIALIVLGTALALYSGYRGGPPADSPREDAEGESTESEVKAAEDSPAQQLEEVAESQPEEQAKPKKNRRGGKRKTRW
jgi:hypothetical protein